MLTVRELTNLHHVRKLAVSTFSGGMKQRFGIAQALPARIIHDDPPRGAREARGYKARDGSATMA